MSERELSVKIVIVDDDEQLRGLCSIIMKQLGIDVVGNFKNGEEALDFFKKNREEERYKIDILLTDVGMPKMDGSELARLVREIYPAESGLKIIFMSGFGIIESQEDAEKNGGNAFIAKPFEIKALKKMILKVLSET